MCWDIFKSNAAIPALYSAKRRPVTLDAMGARQAEPSKWSSQARTRSQIVCTGGDLVSVPSLLRRRCFGPCNKGHGRCDEREYVDEETELLSKVVFKHLSQAAT